MVLNFEKNLPQALKIVEGNNCLEFVVHPLEQERTFESSDNILEKYGKAKWEIVDLLNQEYSHILADSFDLYNWLNENVNDELAYFLNEAGSNVLCYSDCKAPYRFLLWLGKKGFVIGIEQKGKGFDAQEICHRRLKENEGAAFGFFRNCRNEIFFDDSREAKIVYMQFLF